MRQIDLKYMVDTSPSTMYNFVDYYYFSWTSVFFFFPYVQFRFTFPYFCSIFIVCGFFFYWYNGHCLFIL